MEKWKLGYALIKLYSQFAFWISHKKITVLGKENIPYGEPIIFAPNHQNALMDPMAISCTNKTQTVWLARADIFNSRFVTAILHFLKILPIYRIRDGKENLGKNENIFNTAIKVLENKKAIALFPEAAHSGKRQMLVHKKAVPRIAFLAEEKNNFELKAKIVPVGIYYSHYWHFNRSILINYGKPIELSNYKETFEQSEHQATMNLKKEIFSALEELTLEIKSKTNYENFELLRELMGESFEKKKKFHKKGLANRFFSDKKLIELLEQNEKNDSDNFERLHNTLNKYRSLLEENGLDDQIVSTGQQSILKKLIELILATLLLPFSIVGFFIFVIPFWMPRWYIQQKVKDPTFLSTFHFVSGLITHLLFFLFSFSILFLFTKSLLFVVILLVVSFVTGKLGFMNYELWKDIIDFTKYRINKYQNRKKINHLEKIRMDCIQKAQSFLID